MMCVCGCSQILLECNHVGCQYSDRMRVRADGRARPRRQRRSGLAVIRAEIRHHGDRCAHTTGFNRVAWIMPYLVLVAGIGTMIFLVRAWKSRP